jgi:hypothetical protein
MLHLLLKVLESILRQNARRALSERQEHSSQQSSQYVIGVDYGWTTHFTLLKDGRLQQNVPIEGLEFDSPSSEKPQDTRKLIVANPSSDPQDDSSTEYWNITELPERK